MVSTFRNPQSQRPCLLTWPSSEWRRLGFPSIPPNFELWYTYASGNNKELNRAIEARMRDNTLTNTSVRKIYDEFLSPDRFLRRVHKVSETLCGEASQLSQVIEQAADTAGGYGENLSAAARRLNSPHGHQALDEIAVALVQSTQEMVKTNALLHAQLKASETQIRQLQTSLEVLQTESVSDPLTSTLNRNAFEWTFARLIGAAETADDPICLLLVDVDQFKSFNDRYGHQIGDDVLRLVARALKQSIRQGDVVGRLGGDEFAVILPRTPIAGATSLAEEIRQAVTDKQLVRRVTGEKLGHLSISIGVAEFTRGLVPEDVIQRADTALYAAKRGGRDRVVAWAPEK